MSRSDFVCISYGIVSTQCQNKLIGSIQVFVLAWYKLFWTTRVKLDSLVLTLRWYTCWKEFILLGVWHRCEIKCAHMYKVYSGPRQFHHSQNPTSFHMPNGLSFLHNQVYTTNWQMWVLRQTPFYTLSCTHICQLIQWKICVKYHMR